MSTQKQIDANRKNAQKSTGPKTPEGRLASSHNALRHGLTARHIVIDGEDEADFNAMLLAFEAEFQPATALEHTLVNHIVAAQWRLRRLRQIETGFFEMQFIEHESRLEEDYNELENYHKLAFVFERDTLRSNALLSLSRYETRLERSFYRALHELRSLQAARPAPSSVPNEPNSAHPGTSRTVPESQAPEAALQRPDPQPGEAAGGIRPLLSFDRLAGIFPMPDLPDPSRWPFHRRPAGLVAA